MILSDEKKPKKKIINGKASTKLFPELFLPDPDLIKRVKEITQKKKTGKKVSVEELAVSVGDILFWEFDLTLCNRDEEILAHALLKKYKITRK